MLPAMPRELSAFKSITERLGVVGFSSMSDRVRQNPLHLALCSLPQRAVSCPSIRSLQPESIGHSVHTGEHLDFKYATLSAWQATLDCEKLHGHTQPFVASRGGPGVIENPTLYTLQLLAPRIKSWKCCSSELASRGGPERSIPGGLCN